MLKYGLQQAWATPIKRTNLLRNGHVDAKLHRWLEAYADRRELVSGPLSRLPGRSTRGPYSVARMQTRYKLAVFAPPAHRELARIKKILIAESDQYVREAMLDPLPKHEKLAYLWFVIQHPHDASEAVRPHFHEPADVALVYYLSTPTDGSGALVLVDPRGTIDRGGRALPRHAPAFEFSPRRGDLLLFPRYLMHYTMTNTDSRDRKVIGGVVTYDLPRKLKQRYVVAS